MLSFMKSAVFNIYLLNHLWSEVGFDDGLWIYGTIFKIRQAGFCTFGFVFDWHFFIWWKRQLVSSSDHRCSATYSSRSKPLVSFDRTAMEVSKITTWARVSRVTWPGTLIVSRKIFGDFLSLPPFVEWGRVWSWIVISWVKILNGLGRIAVLLEAI